MDWLYIRVLRIWRNMAGGREAGGREAGGREGSEEDSLISIRSEVRQIV